MQAASALLGRRHVLVQNAARSSAAVVVRRPALLGPSRCKPVTRVAAIEEQQTSFPEPSPEQSQLVQEPVAVSKPVISVDPEYAELELAELDEAQEQLLSWMLSTPEEQQEEELDEMVDYDEFGDEEYEELFEEVEQLVDATDVDLKAGDKVVGTVYDIDEEGAYVEIGQKASGFVPLAECSFAKLKTPLEVLRVGMKREFVVVEEEDQYGQTVLSLAAVEASVFWQRIRQLQEEDVIVLVEVESANKGGLLVKYGPYDGFVPVSQFGSQIIPENMEELVGSKIPAKFLEIDEDRERLVFSNKRASSTPTAEAHGLKVGDVVQGTVQSVRPYGAFVDLGGVTGLLHVSQISHDRVTTVEKILAEGDKLKVMILSQDRERGRVTLSTKKLEPNPGDMLRNPQLVFEKAEEMAEQFKKRVEAAELTARGTEQPLDSDVPELGEQYLY